MSCPGEVIDSHALRANLRWISVLSRGESLTLIRWGLPCDGLVSCPGGVIDSYPLGANLRWVSVLSRGESLTLIRWGLTCDGLVSFPGGDIDSNPVNAMEIGGKRRTYKLLGSEKDLAFLIQV